MRPLPLGRMVRDLSFRRVLPGVIALIGLLVMPTLVPYVGTGLDPSWSIALNMAVARGMVFGRDVVFTFGPLGFLASPNLAVPKLGVTAMILRFGLSWMFGWLVSRCLLRGLWWPLAAVCTWFLQWAVVGASSGGAETMLIPVLLLFLGLADALTTRTEAVGRLTLLGCGAGCATALLTKFDTGLLCVLVVFGFLVGEAAALRRSVAEVGRSALWVSGSLLVSTVGWWVLLGQPIGGIPRWLSTNADVFLGYQSAMVSDAPVKYSPAHSIVTVVCVVIAGVVAMVMARRDLRRNLMISLLIFGTLFVFAKQSFTRYDNGHLQRIYTCAAVALVAIVGNAARGGWRPAGRRGGGSSDAATSDAATSDAAISNGATSNGVTSDAAISNGATSNGGTSATGTSNTGTGNRTSNTGTGNRWIRISLVLSATAGSLYCARVGSELVSTMRPNPTSWLSVVKLAVSSSRRDAVVTRQRTYLPPELSIPPEVRAALSEGGVHIEPSETSIAWIFPEIRWRPLPIFQAYSAYTPVLDDLNARAYARRGGPDIVLYRSGPSVDNRVARFESPAAQVAFVCNFRPRVLTDLWQVFIRRSDGDGCRSEPSELATLTARLGREIVLPPLPDDSVVVASFDGFERSAVERLHDTVVRSPKYWFVLGSPDPGEPAHRFVAGTAAQPHIISMPKCLRNAWSTYDTRSYGTFTLRTSEFPAPDGRLGKPITVRLTALRYKCPT